MISGWVSPARGRNTNRNPQDSGAIRIPGQTKPALLHTATDLNRTRSASLSRILASSLTEIPHRFHISELVGTGWIYMLVKERRPERFDTRLRVIIEGGEAGNHVQEDPRREMRYQEESRAGHGFSLVTENTAQPLGIPNGPSLCRYTYTTCNTPLKRTPKSAPPQSRQYLDLQPRRTNSFSSRSYMISYRFLVWPLLWF